jgi:Asp-tRNA(Asn)/Glu-tRNA(Gln) amidotransferase B subunit
MTDKSFNKYLGKIVKVRSYVSYKSHAKDEGKLYIGKLDLANKTKIRLKPYISPKTVENLYTGTAMFALFAEVTGNSQNAPKIANIVRNTLKGRRKEISFPLEEIISVKNFND